MVECRALNKGFGPSPRMLREQHHRSCGKNVRADIVMWPPAQTLISEAVVHRRKHGEIPLMVMLAVATRLKF